MQSFPGRSATAPGGLNVSSHPLGTEKELSATRKKQTLDDERVRRVLDPKVRTIGIDKSALDEQLKEKRSLQNLEKQREDFFNEQALLMDQHAQYLQREADRVRHERHLNLNQFHSTFQKKEMSREWDLHNPKRVLHDLPARVGDDDPRCGAASLQKFEGEDLDNQCRKRHQMNQMRSWAQQQVDEREMKKMMEREYNMAYDKRTEEMAYRAFQVEQSVANQRKTAAITAMEFNKAMAKQKEDEKKRGKHQDTMKNMEEIRNMIDADFLAETQGSREKGMSIMERQAVLDQQQAQREELRQRKLRQAEEERQVAAQEEMERRMAVALERQRERERKQAVMVLGADRKKQADEATSRKKQMDSLYSNEITQEFMGRFGNGR
eukprot:PhM_4_TR3131/c1_g1_i1/m.9188